LISGQGGSGKGLRSDVRALHAPLSLATLVAIAVHGVSLLGDLFLHPTILDISIPFAEPRSPVAIVSAARPLLAPPVSKRMPGGRAIVPAASSTSNRRQRASGLGRAGWRGGA